MGGSVTYARVVVTATEMLNRRDDQWGEPVLIKACDDYQKSVDKFLEPFIKALFEILFWDDYQTHGHGD